MPSSPPHHKRHKSLPYFTITNADEVHDESRQPISTPQSPIANFLSPTVTVGKAGGRIVQSILRRVSPGTSSRRDSVEGAAGVGVPSNANSPSTSSYTTPLNTVPNTPAVQSLPLDASNPTEETLGLSPPIRASIHRADTSDNRGRVRWHDDEIMSPRSRSAGDVIQHELLDEDEDGIDEAEKLSRSYHNLKQREGKMGKLVADLEHTAAEYRRLVEKLDSIVETRTSNATHSFRLVKAALDKHNDLSKVRSPHLADHTQRLSYGFDQLGMKMDELNGDVASLSAQVNSAQRKLPKNLGTTTLTPRQRSWMQWWRTWADYWVPDYSDRKERDEAWRLASNSESWS